MPKQQIPSWLIGTIGALVGASGAITGGIAVERFNDQITRKQSTQAELRERHDNLWNSHQLADAREKHAEIVYIEAVTQDDNSVSGVLAEIADRHYYDAWITMGTAAERDPELLIDSHEEEYNTAVESLPTNERNPRSIRMRMINPMRLASRDIVNSLSGELRQADADLVALQQKQNMAFYFGLVFAALGGIVAALKDLPIFEH